MYICRSLLLAAVIIGVTAASILPDSLIEQGNNRGIEVETQTLYDVNNDIATTIENETEDHNVIKDLFQDSEYDSDVTNGFEESAGNWIILTNKYTKKHRISNFDNFKLEKNKFSEKFSLEKLWKSKILSALGNGENKVKASISRPSLKSQNGNILTILSDDVANGRGTTSRQNVTCTKIEKYNCTLQVTEQHIVPCYWDRSLRCYENRPGERKVICRRKVESCCEGYFMQQSGYCEKPAPVTRNPEIANGCGGVLTSRDGVITSPNYPLFYPNEQNCKWQVIAPTGFRIVLKVIDINMEDPVGACDLRKWSCFKLCEFDQLMIRDVTTGATRTLCGYRAPTSHFVSTGSSVEIIFTSDVSSGGKGFKIVYAIASEFELSTHHPECRGGQEWQVCHERCARTCKRHYNETTMTCLESNNQRSTMDISRRNEITCVPGCACPPSAPIWHNNKCVKPEDCPGDFFKCGKPAVESKLKIVGGRTASKYAWPWMVQIESESIFHICGATLVCSNWVITAAHCFLNIDSTALDLNPRRYIVNVGKYWKNDQGDGRKVQIFEPDRIMVHPKYVVNTETKVDTNDIALIKLSKAVDVNDYVRPICLPQSTIYGVTSEESPYAKYQQPTAGTRCTVLGWGTTRNKGPSSEKLKQATIAVQSGTKCVYGAYDWKLMICAGGHKDQDTCRGDSGGPLLCKRGSEWFIDGVTSFGDACGLEGVAGGYTRVSSYIKWIREHVGYKCEM
ncbi:enteropeptidase-like [Styela clava]